MFLTDAEFSETGDQNVFARFKSFLGEFQDSLHKFCGSGFGPPAIIIDALDDVDFREGHGMDLAKIESSVDKEISP